MWIIDNIRKFINPEKAKLDSELCKCGHYRQNHQDGCLEWIIVPASKDVEDCLRPCPCSGFRSQVEEEQ